MSLKRCAVVEAFNPFTLDSAKSKVDKFEKKLQTG